MPAQKSILIVLTSADTGLTGQPTGWYLPELSHPYYVFKNSSSPSSPTEDSFKLVFASPKGGKAPLDQGSVEAWAADADCTRFMADQEALDLVANTVKLADVKAEDFDAIFYVGGWGPVLDLSSNETSIKLIEEFSTTNKIVSAVCHGPAVFLNAKTANGEALIAGKHFTGFSDAEETALGTSPTIPFMLESALVKAGGLYEKATDMWAAHVTVDGNLYTGQNPSSAGPLAEKIKADLLA